MKFEDLSGEELLENLPEALVLEGPDGIVKDANARACRLLGYERRELRGRDFESNLVGEVDRRGDGGKRSAVLLRKDGGELRAELRREELEGVGGVLVSIREASEDKDEETEPGLEKYREIFHNANDPIFLHGLTEEGMPGRFVEVNRAAREKLGYSREELLSMSPQDIDAGGRARELPGIMEELLSEGQKTFEMIHRTKGGREFPVEISAHVFELGDEELVLSITRDLSERKELEREQRLASFSLDEASLEIYWIDPAGNFLYGNKKVEEKLGYSKEELTDMHVSDVDPTYSEEDREEHWRKLKEQGVEHFESVHRKKSGETYPVELDSHYIDYEGEEYEFAFARDVTERKKVEEQLKRYRMAVEGSEELMAACDENYNYLFANEAYREFYGVDEEEILNASLKELMPERNFGEEVKPRVDRCLRGERIEYEMTREHSELGERWLRIVYYPLKEGREILGAVAVMRDVTERRRTQRALNEERDKLRHLHDAVDRLQQQNDEESILRTAVEVSEDVLGFEYCALDLMEENYTVTKAISSGLSPDETRSYETGEGITGLTVEREETIWGDDLRDHPEARPTTEGFRAYISVPIGEVGVFQVVSREVGQFDEEDVELAEILAGHLLEEIRRVRLEEDLREQAIRDPLTEIYNRRYFNETLGEEVERCRRYGKPIAFLMADINRFKEINDRYSHQKGDRVLREVAGLLSENVRSADTVVRYGGDEFLVMMPETRGEVRKAVARIEGALEEWNERSSLIDFPLSLAMGVSHWNPDQDRDVEEALKEADERMYEDKGR